MCPRDDCRTQNKFIKRTIRFYAGYVSGQDATAYLPPALASVLRGTVQDTENRICRLLFMLTAGMEISDDALRSLCGRCVQNVKKTSGSVTLYKAVKYQRGGVWLPIISLRRENAARLGYDNARQRQASSLTSSRRSRTL